MTRDPVSVVGKSSKSKKSVMRLAIVRKVAKPHAFGLISL